MRFLLFTQITLPAGRPSRSGDDMAVNKVVLRGGTILIDLSGDSVAAAKLLSGTTAHSADGRAITGSLIIKTVHTGSGDPLDSMGTDGDLYLDMG